VDFQLLSLSKNRAASARPLKTRQQTLDSCRNVDLVDLWQLALLVHPAAPWR
jgi:hypothetical protein